MRKLYQDVAKALALLFEYKRSFVLFGVIRAISIVLTTVLTYCFSYFIAELGNGVLCGLKRLTYVIGLLYLCELALSFVAFVLRERIEKNVRVRIKEEIVNDILCGDHSSNAMCDSAKLTEILYSDVNNITTILFTFIELSSTFFLVILSAVIIAYINMWIATIYIIFHLIWLFFYSGFLQKLREKNIELRQQNDEHFKLSRDVLKNSKFIRAANTSVFFLRQYHNNIHVVKETTIKRDRMAWTAGTANKIVDYLWTIILLCIGISQITSSKYSNALFILFVSYAIRFSKSILLLLNQFTQIQNIMVSVERVFSVYQYDKHCKDSIDDGTESLPDNISSISFFNLSYCYPGSEETTITNLCVNISSRFLVIIGANGQGKTTLLNLITGNLPVTDGDILFNGKSIKKISRDNLHKQIAYYMHGEPLFDMTIKENIISALPSGEYTQDDIYSICKKIGFYDDIKMLPNGLDTNINELRSMSTGQKKKIQLIRTFLRPSSILVLDEPLSGLDFHSQKLVSQYLYELSHKKIVIVATHRPEFFNFNKGTQIINLGSAGKREEKGAV